MANFIVASVIVLALAASITYIVKQKKKGNMCIGCANASTCSKCGSCNKK